LTKSIKIWFDSGQFRIDIRPSPLSKYTLYKYIESPDWKEREIITGKEMRKNSNSLNFLSRGSLRCSTFARAGKAYIIQPYQTRFSAWRLFPTSLVLSKWKKNVDASTLFTQTAAAPHLRSVNLIKDKTRLKSALAAKREVQSLDPGGCATRKEHAAEKDKHTGAEQKGAAREIGFAAVWLLSDGGGGSAHTVDCCAAGLSTRGSQCAGK
jgi:hypothetical protein